MKKFLRLTFTLVISVLALFVVPAEAQEADGTNVSPPPALTIAPSIIELDVEPGMKYTEGINVTNGTNTPLPVTTEFKDYTMNEEGMPEYFDDTSGWSPRDWITVKPADFILDANETGEILFEIIVPEKAQNGSHIAAIFFQPVLPEDYFIAESAHIIPYIGGIIALDVRSGEEAERKDFLEIQEFLPVEKEEKEVLSFTTKVYNEDVYFHRVGGTIEIYDIFNNKIHTELVGDITLLPEKLRSLDKELSGKLTFGKYRAELILGESGGETETRVAEFWVPPTLAQVALMLGIMVIGIGILWGAIRLIRNSLRKMKHIPHSKKRTTQKK